MHDVLGEVVVAAGDEDLGAADGVAAVGVLARGRLGAADVAPGLRLGEAHRAAPLPAEHALSSRGAFCSGVPNDSMTSAAPKASPGYMAKAVLAPLIISSTSTCSVCGAPAPPYSGSTAIDFQPAS